MFELYLQLLYYFHPKWAGCHKRGYLSSESHLLRLPHKMFVPWCSLNVLRMLETNVGNPRSSANYFHWQDAHNWQFSHLPLVVITQVLYLLAPTGAPYAATTLHITSPNTSNLNITFSSTSTSKHDFWLEHSVTTDTLDYSHTSGTKQHNSRNWWNTILVIQRNLCNAIKHNLV